MNRFTPGAWRLRATLRRRLADLSLYVRPQVPPDVRVWVAFTNYGDSILSVHHTPTGAAAAVRKECGIDHEHLTTRVCGVWEAMVEP